MNKNIRSSGVLVDYAGTVWARFTNAQEKYGAIVADCELIDMPDVARAIFAEQERRVSRQEFSMLEDVERKLRTFTLWVIWEHTQEKERVSDVQITDGGVSFKPE
jgi:hypothetical protein